MFQLKISPFIVGLTSASLLVPVGQSLQAQELKLETSLTNRTGIYLTQRLPRLRFKLPSRGVPGARIGGATRQGSKTVTALIPQQKLGLTASDSPTIFVYIPESESTQANLTITNQKDGKLLYENEFDVPQKTGILRIKLPQTLDLQENETYKWEVKLLSSDDNPMTSLKLKTFGWMEKVSLPEEKLNEEETWDKLNTLAEAGIWHDTLEQLALLRLENPGDAQIEAEWNELLSSVGLNSFSESDILTEIVKVQ